MNKSCKKVLSRLLAFVSIVVSNTVLMFNGLAEAATATFVSTGDQSPLKWVLIVLACAIVAVVITIIIRRKYKK